MRSSIAVYLYLMSLATTWPINAPPPDLLPGTLVTLILLVSLVPNILISRWAEQQDLRKVQDRAWSSCRSSASRR